MSDETGLSKASSGGMELPPQPMLPAEASAGGARGQSPKRSRRARSGPATADAPAKAVAAATKPDKQKNRDAASRGTGKARILTRKGEPDLIVLPALKPRRKSPAASKAAKSAAVAAAGEPRIGSPSASSEASPPAAAPTAVAPSPLPEADKAELLPEYRSQTSGLRELLASIDPLEADYRHPSSLPAFPSSEDGMHIPHNRPGVLGSPDLPIDPAGWLRHSLHAVVAVLLLGVAGFIYSHLTSPGGVNWEAFREASGASVPVHEAKRLPTATDAASAVAASAIDDVTLAEIETTSRMATTSARADAGMPKVPAFAEFDMSSDELERQIRALERSMPEAAPEQHRKTAAVTETKTTQPTAAAQTASAAAAEDVAASRAASIDPEMEQQIFARATAYLKQRDIASARMILTYAASLGSGISALSLAETYDPAYLSRISLQGVDADVAEARKWYKTAASFGIKEAEGRIKALE